jgi:hypothetical protein
MLTPSLGFEAGKGRELELERKAAARRQLEEARAGQRVQPPPRRPSLLQRIKDAVAPAGRVDAGSARARGYDEHEQPVAP